MGVENAAPIHVETLVNFLVDTEVKPVNIPSTPGGGKSQHIGNYETRTVKVFNARSISTKFSIDREGFALVKLDTNVKDFYDQTQIEAIYNKELEILIKGETGANKVVVFDHTLRAGDPSIRQQKMVREPVQRAHNDYTIKSGPVRVRDWFGEKKSGTILKNRFAIINVWRSIVGKVERDPLALCDARSVSLKNLVATERRAKERVGETYRLTFDPEQKWFYFPRMKKNEAILIKSYESDTNGRARFTPHTAFEDPTSESNGAQRQSIESRVFAFFD